MLLVTLRPGHGLVAFNKGEVNRRCAIDAPDDVVIERDDCRTSVLPLATARHVYDEQQVRLDLAEAQWPPLPEDADADRALDVLSQWLQGRRARLSGMGEERDRRLPDVAHAERMVEQLRALVIEEK